MQKQNMNWFATVPRVVICFIILTDLTELSVEFGVDEVFEDRGVMTHKYRGSMVVLSISKSVEHNEEQKEMISGFQ